MTATIPGEGSISLARSLRQLESRNVTYVCDAMPIFWQSAQGATVTDVDGNTYTDLTAAFGVANAGHGNAAVARAISQQARTLQHAMGDVHPANVKVQLLEALHKIAPPALNKTLLGTTGADAVEAALKTAMLSTGKTAFAAFRGGYHGLSLGALQVTAMERFRAPFVQAVPSRTEWLEYPRNDVAGALERTRMQLRARRDFAAVIVEPLQGRAGCIVPVRGFLPGLREICAESGLLLIFDELYTGFGRTGTIFALEDENVEPDILCAGKAMGNGLPISATIARAEIMDAWPPSDGEALHTSTHLGNPIACAAAIAAIAEMERLQLPARAKQLQGAVQQALRPLVEKGKALDVRGRGLMWGIELRDGDAARTAVERALREGVLLLQAGERGNVLSITPPLTIGYDELNDALTTVVALL